MTTAITAITKRTRPYETLIRHNDDGSIGAHHQKIDEIVMDGVVISATVLPPEPLAQASSNDPELAQLIGAAALQAIDDANTQKVLVESLKTTLDEASHQVVYLSQQVVNLNQQVQTLTYEKAELEKIVESLATTLAQKQTGVTV